MTDTLWTYTIYDHPTDYPRNFVVKKWGASKASPDPFIDDEFIIVCDTLDQARAAIPEGLYRLSRHPTDAPAIVETWF